MNFLYAMILAEPGETPNVFALTQNVSLWTLIIFLVLLAALSKFAFPHILGYAAAREARIQQALDEARRQREETEALLAQQREELAQARVQAQQLITEGKQSAERVRHELLQQARTEGDDLIERARREIAHERTQAIESLRREAADLAIAAASKLIGQRLDAPADRQLVTDFLGRVESADTGAGAA